MQLLPSVVVVVGEERARNAKRQKQTRSSDLADVNIHQNNIYNYIANLAIQAVPRECAFLVMTEWKV